MTSPARDLAALIRRCREESFYPTPQAFYRAWGKAFLRCDLRTYLRIESGISMPRPGVFGRILEALSLSCNARQLRAVGRLYAGHLLGEALPWAQEFIASTGPVSKPGATTASPQRWSPAIKERADLACLGALLVAEGPLQADHIAKTIGLPAKTVVRSLARLGSGGLVSHEPRSGWLPLVQVLDSSGGSEGEAAFLSGLSRGLAYEEEECTLDLLKLAHCSRSEASSFFELLSQSLDSALHPVERRDEERGLYLFEVSARLLIADVDNSRRP